MVERGAEPSGTQLTEEVLSEMSDWEAAHPHATFAELEAAVEERLDRLRPRLLERALRTQARTAAAGPATCPTCGVALVARGERTRTVTVPGGGTVPLERHYQTCPACGTGLFPPG